MLASRGMGAIRPSKMPKGKKTARRDDTDFTQYAEGGKVNAAGNYTKPSLRKRIVSQVKAAATQGTGAGILSHLPFCQHGDSITGARDLIFRVGFEPTSDFLHLVLPPRKTATALQAKKALLIVSEKNFR